MKARIFCFIFFAIFIFSCSSKDKAPSDIIQPEAMKNILWDVMSAQFMAQEISRKDSLVNAMTQTKALTQKVFDIHKITAADFDKSYDWYIRHPEIMKRIFDSLYTQKQRDHDLEIEKKYLDNSLKKKIPVK
jgi:hypothetical protein